MSELKYQRHYLSAAWGDMADDVYQELKDSLENVGLQNPIVLFEGQVIDGWHRYKACDDLGIAYKTVELGADVDPQHYAISTNTRRSQTQAQRAISFSQIFAWKKYGDNQHESRVGTECPPSHSAKEIADKAGVSTRTVKQAKEVITKAEPEVVKAVKAGTIGLPKAAQIAALPKDQQAAAINKPLPKKDRPAVVAKPAEPDAAPQPVAEYTEIDRLRDEISFLQSELARITDERAIANSDLSEEGKAEAAEIIAQLRKDLKQAEIERDAMRQSRDAAMNDVVQLKKQVDIWRRKAEKVAK